MHAFGFEDDFCDVRRILTVGRHCRANTHRGAAARQAPSRGSGERVRGLSDRQMLRWAESCGQHSTRSPTTETKTHNCGSATHPSDLEASRTYARATASQSQHWLAGFILLARAKDPLPKHVDCRLVMNTVEVHLVSLKGWVYGDPACQPRGDRPLNLSLVLWRRRYSSVISSSDALTTITLATLCMAFFGNPVDRENLGPLIIHLRSPEMSHRIHVYFHRPHFGTHHAESCQLRPCEHF